MTVCTISHSSVRMNMFLIGPETFRGCTSLKEIYVPSSFIKSFNTLTSNRYRTLVKPIMETNVRIKNALYENEKIKVEDEVEENNEEGEPIPLALVSEKPNYPDGGTNGFNEWVQSRLMQKHINSEDVGKRATLGLIIHVDGSVTSKMVRGINDSLDQVILEIVSSSPKWQPGYNHGKKVAVQMNTYNCT